MPVLIYKGKNLCRGATLSVGAEQFGRRGWDLFSTGGEGVVEDGASNLPDMSRLGRQEDLCDKVRGQDVKLLKELRVRIICDLMYQQKRLKFLMPVASSEKVDKAGRFVRFYVSINLFIVCFIDIESSTWRACHTQGANPSAGIRAKISTQTNSGLTGKDQRWMLPSISQTQCYLSHWE